MVTLVPFALVFCSGCGGDTSPKYPVFSKDNQTINPDVGALISPLDGGEKPADGQLDSDTTSQTGPDVHDVATEPPCESQTRELARVKVISARVAGDEEEDERRIEDVSALFFGDEVVVAWGERIDFYSGAGYVARYKNDGAVAVAPKKVFNAADATTTRLRMASDGVNTLVVYEARFVIPDEDFNGQDTSGVDATFFDGNLEPGLTWGMSDLLDNGWNVVAKSPYVFYPYEGKFMVAWNDWRMEDTSGFGQHYFQFGVYYSLIDAEEPYPSSNRVLRQEKSSFGSTRRSMSLHEGTVILHVNKNIYLQPLALASEAYADFLDYAKLGEDAWAVWTRGESVSQWHEDGNEVRARRTAKSEDPDGENNSEKGGQCCSTEGELGCNVLECLEAICAFSPQCCETWTETCVNMASFAGDICCGEGAGSGGGLVTTSEEPVTVATGGYFLGSRIVKSTTGLYLVWTENRTQEPGAWVSGDDHYEVQKFKVQNLGDLESSPSTLDVELSGKLLDIEDYRLIDDHRVELLSARLDEGDAVLEITTMCLP